MKKLIGKKVIIDASVLVKIIAEEKSSSAAQELIRLCLQKKIKLILPELIFYEIINAITFNKETPIADTIFFILELKKIAQKIVLLEEQLISQVIEIIQKHKLTSYDSVYIATAELENAFLITADFKHHKKNISDKIIYLNELSF